MNDLRDVSRISPLLDGPVVFDAMVPRSLARVNRFGPIENAFAGRARWPEAVGNELRKVKPKVGGLGNVLGGRFGKEIELPSSAEAVIADLRSEITPTRVLLSNRLKNLGEAQCIWLCQHESWPLVTHDDSAVSMASAHRVTTFDVIDVLLACVGKKVIKPGPAWKIYEKLCEPTSSLDPDLAAMFALVAYPPWHAGTKQEFIGAAAELYAR